VLPLRSGMHLPVLMQFAITVVTTARQYDHDVLLVTSDEGVAGLQRVAASAMVDGLVLMDVELHDVRVPALRKLDRPSVLIGVPADTTGLTCVDLDFMAAGERCVEHLVALGHRHIALVGAPSAVYERETGFAERTRSGFIAAVQRHGLQAITTPCEDTYEGVRATVTELFAAYPNLTGLVVHNEAAIDPLMDVLRGMGRRVPEEVSVVAICPDEMAERRSPPLSSVLIPAHELGQEAVTLLMRKLDGHPTEELTLLAPRLTARGSTAPPSAV